MGLGTTDTVISRIRRHSDTELNLNDNDSPSALDLGTYFAAGGDGNDLTLYLQTSADGLVSFAVSAQIGLVGANFARFTLPADAQTLLDNISTGDRFIFAFARPASVSVDHAVNAGAVSWAFALPQPTITHTSPVPVDHAVDAGDASWAIDLPQPTVTHTSVLPIDHAVDAGNVSWSFALPEPTVTHTPAASGDEVSVTVPLTGESVFDDYIRWSDDQSLGSTFAANGLDQVLSLVDLNNANPPGRVRISITGLNNDFTPAFEATGRLIFEASDGMTLEVMIADADMTEIYQWTPTNSAEVVAFVLHVKGLIDQSATLTLTGEGTATTTDHAVDAGNVGWAFDLPQPTVTHTSVLPLDHAVDAGAASWAFDLPEPTVTHTSVLPQDHAVNAGAVSWSFALPDPTVTLTSATPATAPDRPATPTIGSITSSSAVVTWVAPADGGSPLTGYTLRHRQSGETLWTETAIGADATTHTLTSLLADTGYEVRIRAENTIGNSGYSLPRVDFDTLALITVDHAVDAGAVSWVVALPQPRVSLITPTVAVATLEIDFDNDGTFGHVSADVTGDLVRHSLSVTRGRTLQSRRRATAGRLKAKLWNLAAKYDPINSSSPIYERDLTGVRVRVLLDGVIVWGGILDRPNYRRRPVPQVDIIALGRLSTLRQPVSVAAQESKSIGAIAKLVGDATGINTTHLTGGKTLDRWKGVKDQDALSVFRELEETEEGFLFERLDGEVALEAENARSTGASMISALTLKDQIESPTDVAILRGSGLELGYRQIANVVIVPVETLTEGAEQVLYTSAQDIYLAAGTGTTILFEYPTASSNSAHQGVVSWVTPVSGTDYTAVTGLNVTGVVVGDRYQVTLANTSGLPITIAAGGLQVRGRPLVSGAPIWVESKDAASIVTFGEREYTRSSRLFTTIGAAQEYADGIVSRQRVPQGWLVARWPAYKAATQARSLDLSRRITVERLGQRADYFIEGVGITLRGFVRMEYLLSPVPGKTKPSAPVVTVAKVAGETTRLAVSWSYPFDGGSVITDYDVRYKRSTDTDWADWPHTGTGRTTTLTGLEPTGLPGSGSGNERAGYGIVVC